MIRINLIGAGGGGTAGRSTGWRGGAADLAATGVVVLALGWRWPWWRPAPGHSIRPRQR